jgi:hypothetical protein
MNLGRMSEQTHYYFWSGKQHVKILTSYDDMLFGRLSPLSTMQLRPRDTERKNCVNFSFVVAPERIATVVILQISVSHAVPQCYASQGSELSLRQVHRCEFTPSACSIVQAASSPNPMNFLLPFIITLRLLAIISCTTTSSTTSSIELLPRSVDVLLTGLLMFRHEESIRIAG